MDPVDYQPATVNSRAPRSLTQDAITIAIALVSSFSLLVIYQSADAEPYTTYRRADALVQVGVGMTLLLSWVVVAGLIVWLVVARRLSRRWLWVLLWALFCGVNLKICVFGYLQDIERYVLPAAAGKP